MKTIISLDTEDYVSPQALDAQKWWAETLSGFGIRASFQCVAELTRKWRRENRDDIIKAVAKHEIGYHTNYHSLHPTHPEAVQNLSFKDALNWVFDLERPGVELVKEVFGRTPVTYCPPGDSWTPTTLLAMALMGIKVCADTPFGDTFKRPFWYCGTLLTHYRMNFETYYNSPDPLGEFKKRYLKIAEELGDASTLIIYTHPTTLTSSNYWDIPLAGGKEIPVNDIPPAPKRDSAEIKRCESFVESALEWLVKARSTEFTDYQRLYESQPTTSRRTVDLLLNEAGITENESWRLTERSTTRETFLKDSVVDSFRYDWLIHSPNLKADKILEDAKKLLWTSGPGK